MEEKTEKTWKDLPKAPLFVPKSSSSDIRLVKIPEGFEQNYYTLAESVVQANEEYGEALKKLNRAESNFKQFLEKAEKGILLDDLAILAEILANKKCEAT